MNRHADFWPIAAGPQLAAVSFVVDSQDGVLTVAVASPAWRDEMIAMADRLIERINHALLQPGGCRRIEFIAWTPAPPVEEAVAVVPATGAPWTPDQVDPFDVTTLTAKPWTPNRDALEGDDDA